MEGYLLHGTNQPYGVGMRVSHGCVRLYPEHIEQLYAAVALGTPVHIVNQPVLAAWHEGELVVQAFAPLEDDERATTAVTASVLPALDALQNKRNKAAAARRLNQLVTEASGLATAIVATDGQAPQRRWPTLVANDIVVDNPLSDEELDELMTLADEAASMSSVAGE